jgi:hypothetical protein
MTDQKIKIQSGRGEDLRVTIKDEASGQPLVNFILTGEQVWTMLGGGIVHVDGQVIRPEHFHRVGKTMVNDSVTYTSADLSASTYDQQLDDAETMARADRPGWEVYNARRRGGGSGDIHVWLRRWE